MELDWFRCMKNQTTSEALITAIVIATMKLNSPSSIFDTATVVNVSTIKARKTAT